MVNVGVMCAVGEDEEESAEAGEQEKVEGQLDLRITAQRIHRSRFPTYVPPNVKDDMVSKSLCVCVCVCLFDVFVCVYVMMCVVCVCVCA